METEKKLEEVSTVEEMQEEKPVDVAKTIFDAMNKNGANGTKWIRNEAEGTKKCDACGAVMRGWAYREPFQYCPKCGAMADKAQ